MGLWKQKLFILANVNIPKSTVVIWFSAGRSQMIKLTACWFWYVNITKNYQLLLPQSHVYISRLLKTRQQWYTINISYNLFIYFVHQNNNTRNTVTAVLGTQEEMRNARRDSECEIIIIWKIGVGMGIALTTSSWGEFSAF